MAVLFLSRLSRLILSGAAALILIGTAPLHAQSIAVMVNGEPITHYDIEQRSKLNTLSHKATTRQQVIDELIDEKVKIKEAKKFGVDPTASDIDAAFNQMSSRMHLSADQLAKSLESQGIRPDTLKARIKADMVWGSLVRGRFKESLQVGEKDVAAAVQVNGEEKDKPQTESFEYQMRPIVLVVP
ncbi:MAG TPA: SurA N-terminal domain-containing protein, partial [Bradyrhizobium sp.]|nr:SurA N-terminal domain-containing protein [Bradyrhizobium sp.]